MPKEEVAPLSISPLPNDDWRAIAKNKKELYVPARAQQPTTETKPEVLSQSATSFGLQIQKKRNTIDNDQVMTEATTIEQENTTDAEEKAPKSLEERAIEAIIKGKST